MPLIMAICIIELTILCYKIIVQGQFIYFCSFQTMPSQTNDLGGIASKFLVDYKGTTPMKLKCIDAYLAYCFFTGVIQVC